MIKTESEFLQFALHNYDNPKLSFLEEFEADLKRFQYVNQLLNRYRLDKTDIPEKLVLNHIVILCNCFSIRGAIIMFDYKISKQNMIALNTCLYYIGAIEKSEIGLDFYLLDIISNND